jgi:hypothetical protein
MGKVGWTFEKKRGNPLYSISLSFLKKRKKCKDHTFLKKNIFQKKEFRGFS